MSFDKEMKKVRAWEIEKGLTDFDDAEILVNGMKKIDDDSIEVDAFVNIYLKNGELHSAQIKFAVEKR